MTHLSRSTTVDSTSLEYKILNLKKKQQKILNCSTEFLCNSLFIRTYILLAYTLVYTLVYTLAYELEWHI